MLMGELKTKALKIVLVYIPRAGGGDDNGRWLGHGPIYLQRVALGLSGWWFIGFLLGLST